MFWLDARHLKNGFEDGMQHTCYYDAPLDSSTNETFYNANVSWHGRNVETHASHIILCMLHLTTKPYSSMKRETVHINKC